MILETVQKATALEWAKGMAWYEDARRYCEGLASAYNSNLERVGRMLAVMSPRVPWDRNKMEVEWVLKAITEGSDPTLLPCTAYKSNIRKAVRIHSGELDALSGPKVTSFADNIINPASEAVTIDTWAYRIYEGNPHEVYIPHSITPKRYGQAQEAYREAAYAMGILPYQMQAISWGVAHRLVGE